MIKIKRNSLFLKYLISYTIMFMLPTLVLAFFINNILLERLREQYLKNSRENLNQTISAINQDLVRIDMIAEHILINRTIRPTFNLEDVANALSIIDELRKYTISNNFTKEIALYFHGDSFVYSSQTSSTYDSFITSNYYYTQDEGRKAFIDLLQTGKEGVLPYQNINILGFNRNLLTVVKPVKIAGNKASLVFFIDDLYTKEMQEKGIYIFDENNISLRELAFDDEPEKNHYTSRLLNAFEADAPFANIDENNKLFALIENVPSYQWRAAYIGNEQAIYGDFKIIQIWFWLLFFAVMLVSVVFTALNMAFNYNPLRKLSKAASELYNKEPQGKHNEWSSIKDTINYLFDENNKIKSQIVPAVRATFLQQLLKGRIETKDEFERKTTEYDMKRLCHEHIFVLVCCFKSDTNILDVATVEEIVATQISGYCREHSERNTYIFVGSITAKQKEKLPYYLLNVHALLCKASGKRVTVAISSLHKDFSAIPTAFIEASLAFDYRFVKGWNNIIEYSELVLNDRMGAAYPQQLFEKLTYHIKSRNPDQINLALDNIIDYIKNTDLPLYYAKGLCYQLINNVSVILAELGEMAHVKQSALSYATVLAEFETADELIVAVKNICINICDYMRENAQLETSSSVQDIKTFIDNNCLDINFSIQTVSDKFNMSLSALSLFFKNNTGTNISDYAASIRMIHAKDLLAKGKQNLAEIAQAVGYMSASSFIRRFKTMYGITPGQFVQLNEKKDK